MLITSSSLVPMIDATTTVSFLKMRYAMERKYMDIRGKTIIPTRT